MRFKLLYLNRIREELNKHKFDFKVITRGFSYVIYLKHGSIAFASMVVWHRFPQWKPAQVSFDIRFPRRINIWKWSNSVPKNLQLKIIEANQIKRIRFPLPNPEYKRIKQGFSIIYPDVGLSEPVNRRQSASVEVFPIDLPQKVTQGSIKITERYIRLDNWGCDKNFISLFIGKTTKFQGNILQYIMSVEDKKEEKGRNFFGGK